MAKAKKKVKAISTKESMGLANPLNKDLGDMLKYDDLAGITIGGTLDALGKAFDDNRPLMERWAYGSKSANSFMRMAMATYEAIKQFSETSKKPKNRLDELADKIEKLEKENKELKKLKK
jgi:hypothetical protein